METKKLLTTLVVFAVVLAAMSTIIEAQRGGIGGGMGSSHGSGMGGHGGGSGGGHHWGVNAGSDNDNVDDNNNAGYVEVYVSTDKRMYVLNEPIEITVTAYNPTDFTITLVFSSITPTCQASYAIDGISPAPTTCNFAIGNAALPPGDSTSWIFTHKESVFQLPVGRHSVVGILLGGLGGVVKDPDSDPITIRVVESNNGGMG